jgi:hypothetical protein
LWAPSTKSNEVISDIEQAWRKIEIRNYLNNELAAKGNLDGPMPQEKREGKNRKMAM